MSPHLVIQLFVEHLLPITGQSSSVFIGTEPWIKSWRGTYPRYPPNSRASAMMQQDTEMMIK